MNKKFFVYCIMEEQCLFKHNYYPNLTIHDFLLIIVNTQHFIPNSREGGGRGEIDNLLASMGESRDLGQVGRWVRWVGGQMCRWVGGQMGRCVDGQVCRWVDVQVGRWVDGQVRRWIGVQVDRCVDGQVGKWVGMAG